MRKVRGSKTAKVMKFDSSVEGIEFDFDHSFGAHDMGDGRGDGVVERVDVGKGRRDEVFNVVLGWSGLRWRALQLKSPPREEGQEQAEA